MAKSTKTIKVRYSNEVLTITKVGPKRWRNIHAYGLTNRIVWKDQNGDMWVRMSGKWIQVQYYIMLRGRIVEESMVEPAGNCRTAEEVAA